MGTEPTKPDDKAAAEATRAIERVKKSLTGYTKGARGPNGDHYLVELLAADVRCLCMLANEETEIVKAQTKGCAISLSEERGKQNRKVTIQADDAFHLLENAG